MHIEFVDLKRQYFSIKSEIDQAVHEVLQSAHFIGGPQKDNFEREFAKAHSSKHCVSLANGTDALFLLFKALNYGPGDEVLVPANSFIASSETVSAVGARPRFCDISESTFNIDPEVAENILASDKQKKIKAILAVHLYGRMAPMQKLADLCEKYQVTLLEDAAQAHLARYQDKGAGHWGRAATFSFYPGKNLGAYGDAGALLTEDSALAEKVRKLANHGRTSKYEHDMEGYNSRMDSMQAAILRVKLKHLAEWTHKRQNLARNYSRLLEGIPGLILPEIPGGQEHVFHLYVVRHPRRDHLLQRLKEAGVEALIHYPVPLPRLQAYAYLPAEEKDSCPIADRVSTEIFSLPIYPELKEEEQKSIAEILRRSLQ